MKFVGILEGMLTEEDPQNAGKYLENISAEAMIDDLSGYEASPDGFIEKLKAQAEIR